MADTKGLMESRKAWTEAVAAGETDLPHDKWYEQQVAEAAKQKQVEIKKGYNNVAVGRSG